MWGAVLRWTYVGGSDKMGLGGGRVKLGLCRGRDKVGLCGCY